MTDATEPTPTVSRMMRLDGSTALIAGGYGDLASAMADALAELGCNIVLAARHLERCKALADDIEDRHGVSCAAVRADISQEREVEALIDQSIERFRTLDVVVNNAAIYWSAAPEAIPLERGWRRVLDVNLTGTFLMCRAAGRVMLEQGRGSIINVSSSGGLMSYLPEAGSTISYTTTKGAIINLTRDLAAQWAEHGVRVNALAPGIMDAGLMTSVPEDRAQEMVSRVPMRRAGRPSELKGAVAYLASPLSSYVTGSVLVVDGGQTIV